MKIDVTLNTDEPSETDWLVGECAWAILNLRHGITGLLERGETHLAAVAIRDLEELAREFRCE